MATETTKPDDGGPAFPGAELPAHPNHPTGMSLRDWFAGQWIASTGTWVPNGAAGQVPNWSDKAAICKDRAEYAYMMADALLSARNGEAA